jgi:hypothetical protein
MSKKLEGKIARSGLADLPVVLSLHGSGSTEVEL